MNNTEPTTYTRIANRCPNCGHRLSMREGRKRCMVVIGDGHEEANDRRCDCRNHERD